LSCVAVLVVCCGLAWWQWSRFTAVDGTFQNLGYVLQWPLFGLFPAFMVWRFRKLAARHRSVEPASTRVPVQTTVIPEKSSGVDSADDELAAYNRYLAELHATELTAQEKQ
jgi:hypothetical protein